jgi:hypothetical protein
VLLEDGQTLAPIFCEQDRVPFGFEIGRKSSALAGTVVDDQDGCARVSWLLPGRALGLPAGGEALADCTSLPRLPQQHVGEPGLAGFGGCALAIGAADDQHAGALRVLPANPFEKPKPLGAFAQVQVGDDGGERA